MPTSRFRVGLRLIALTLACAPTAFVAETWAQSSDRSPVQELTDQAAVAAAATQFVAIDEGGLGHPATSITASTPISIPAVGVMGAAGPYPASLVVSGFQGAVGRLSVRLNNLSHTWPGDLEVLLVGPGGQKVILMSDAGAGFIEHVSLTFDDGAGALPETDQIVSGRYKPTDFENPGTESLPVPAPPAPYSQSLLAFNGVNPNGTWTLYVSDDGNGETGSLAGFTLIITPQFNNTTPSPVPTTGTSGPTDSLLTVSGINAPITKVSVSLHITHPFDNELDISLVGPDGTTVELSSDNGDVGDNYGGGCPSGTRTIFDDNPALPLITTGTAPFIGPFRPEQPLSAFIGKSGAAANGTWKLHIEDDTNPFVGVLQCWSVVITQDEDTIIQPPSALTATFVAGNQVTLRWAAPAAGPAPTNYVLEGGVNPGETVANLSTGGSNPILTFAAPTGSFFVRLRSQAGASLSAVSNEIRLVVNLPIAPSPPAQFLSVVNGSSVELGWRNTFEGGAPTSLVVDVTGAAVASIPIGLSDSISFSGVPAGEYTLQLRAVNAGGASVPSNSTTFSVTTSCMSSLLPPSDFLAYNIGNTLHLVWQPSLSSIEPATGFIVDVSGAFTGSFPISGRSVSGTVGPGTYNFSVAATNACGVSRYTAVQSVTIP
jgi:subtilisin-like proprotein convertase family protein